MQKSTRKPPLPFAFNLNIFHTILLRAPRSTCSFNFGRDFYRHSYFLAPHRKPVCSLWSDRVCLPIKIPRYLRIPLSLSQLWDSCTPWSKSQCFQSLCPKKGNKKCRPGKIYSVDCERQSESARGANTICGTPDSEAFKPCFDATTVALA